MQWQTALQDNLRTVEDLLPYLPLDAEEQRQMAEILEQFPLAVTPYYLSLIDFSDPADPIRKMAIPSLAETRLEGSFDTSGEADNTVIDGLQHKYAETAMILSTNHCAMYCRHCFRKRLVGLSSAEVVRHLGEMHAYIRQHTEITNVLISGGDALLNTNERLGHILSMLVNIPHLDAIRIASRTPVVFPERVLEDGPLLEMLSAFAKKKQLYLITQYNHPRELTDRSIASIRAIQSVGIPIKNQTVLLRGVNDDPRVLAALLQGLVRTGIAPYYIFQCRPVTGVKTQFQVPLRKGVEVVRQATSLQNGLGKTFHYCMSHVTGKLEILGMLDAQEMLFRYHEAHDPKHLGTFLRRPVSGTQTWLADDLQA